MDKLLFISHTFPYPPNEGIKLPVYYLLKEFSKTTEVGLISFIQPQEEKYIPEIKKYCYRLITLPYPGKSFWRRLFNTFFEKLPYNVVQFFNRDMLMAINQELSRHRYQAILFDFLTTAIYGKFISPKVKTVLHYHDAVSMLFYRNFLVERNCLKKIYWFSQYKKISRFEEEFPNYFDRITVVAEKDRKWLIEKSKIAGDKIVVIPNGVDVDYFSPKALNMSEDYPSIIFRGIMSFPPNIDACLYFLREIFPLVKNKIPEIKFYIVGPNPDKKILKIARKDRNIIVTGYVNDIREYILKATVNVCPMISGSGIKNKILEAMALGKASVVTPIAAEGIPELEDGENVLVANTPREFAGKIILLIRDENLRGKIGNNAREFVVKNYTWQKASEKFENLLAT